MDAQRPPASAARDVPARPPALSLPEEADSPGTPPRPLTLSFDLSAGFALSPLNRAVRLRWTRASDGDSASTLPSRRDSLGAASTPGFTPGAELDARLAAAAARRLAFREWTLQRARRAVGTLNSQAGGPEDGASHHASSARARLDARIAAAAARRTSLLVARLPARRSRMSPRGASATSAEARAAALAHRLAAAEARRRARLSARRARARAPPRAVSVDVAREAAAEALRTQACTRVLQRRWRAWAAAKRTSASLAAAFLATGVTLAAGAVTGFDEFAAAMQAPHTIRATRAFLRRLDVRLCAAGRPQQAPERAALERLFPTPPGWAGAVAERYPPRVLLCAWMVRLHPSVVLQGRTASPADRARETALASAAVPLVASFEALAKRLAVSDGWASAAASPCPSPSPASQLAAAAACREDEASLAAALRRFDAQWASYLDCFAVWKAADAAVLEAELVTCAVALHDSLAAKCGAAAAAAAVNPAISATSELPADDGSPASVAAHDRAAMCAAVREDVGLLRDRVVALGGPAGGARLATALEAATAAAGAAEAAAVDAAASANERLFHTLMHEAAGEAPAVQTPGEDESDDEGAEALEVRVRRMMRRAFWDLVAASVEEAGNAHVSLMAELAAGMESMCAAREAAALRSALAAASAQFRTALAAGDDASARAALRAYTTAAASVLRQAGAPAREAAFNEALDELESSAPAQPLGQLCVAALRLLATQLGRLKSDVAAFARGALLAPAARGALGAEWAAARFARRHGLPDPPAPLAPGALPRSRRWLAAAAALLPPVEAALGPAVAAAAESRPAAPVPVMRSGRASVRPAPAPATACPGVASLRSTAALLRIGLVMAMEAPPDEEALPELLVLDAQRIAAASTAFAALVASAAALALLPQLRPAAPPVPDAAAELCTRLRALRGSGSLSVADLAAETARSAWGGGVPSADAVAAAERSLLRLLGGGARASLTAAIASAVRVHLLVGSATGSAAARAALRRCGGEVAELGGDVERLAACLDRIAVVCFRVHGACLELAAQETGRIE